MSRRLLQTSALQVAGEVGCPEKCFGGFGFIGFRVQAQAFRAQGLRFMLLHVA